MPVYAVDVTYRDHYTIRADSLGDAQREAEARARDIDFYPDVYEEEGLPDGFEADFDISGGVS